MMIGDFEKQLMEWRHYLHSHPETAFEEKNTSDFLADVLTEMGLEVHRNIVGTGIVANLTVGDGTGIIGIRSDIDAINLTEVGQYPYTSKNPGKMHGCGHDGHMATVLGAARLLSERKNFNGSVRFIFQPAEEPGKGANVMIQDGLFDMDPGVPAVISCAEFITDGAHNAIPTNVVIKGDTRSYTPKVQKLLEDRMRTISEGICKINGAECQFEYTHEFAPTSNWAECVDVAVKAAQNVVGENNVDGNCPQWMASEDFGAFLRKVPGCFVFIGNGDESEGVGNVPLHNSCYDFNDKILTVGAEYFAELIKIRLPK